MCGILGIIGRTPADADVFRVQKALGLQRNRGPNDEGYALFDDASRCILSLAGDDTPESLGLRHVESAKTETFDVAFAFRRLSILDVSPAGHQPMLSHDGRYVIVFNGEVYNFVELRSELAQRGHPFRSGTDTEVILAAYAEWGESMLPRLVGMFALAILDTAERTVMLARDPFGIKPLYWKQAGQAVAFASQIAPLLALDNAPRVANVDALYAYMRFGQTDASEATMFAGVQQLLPAHCVTFGTDGSVRKPIRSYWVPGAVAPRKIGMADASRELKHLFDESVRLHLRSDVPLGSCLSGGLDSTAIVASMRSHLGPDAPIHAFSFVSDDPVRGEGPYVDIAAEAFSLEKHSVFPTADDLVADLDALVRVQEQPFDSTSIYAQFCVFRLARQAGITVMLDGQGADELFGGYPTAVSAQLTSAILRGSPAAVRGLLTSSHMSAPGARTRIALTSLGRMLPLPLVAPFMSMVGESLYPDWLDARWFRARGHDAAPREQGRGRNALREELLHFVRSHTLPRLLRYEDRNSMAFSIESRVPFCTTAIADFAFSLPSSFLVAPDGETKSVLRQAMKGVVPDAIIHRPKVGFETPERAWLNTLRPWIADITGSASFRSLPFLRHDVVGKAIDDQLANPRAMRPLTWRFLNIGAWAREFNVQFQ
ncbi:asparagine synthase (glutamine-hydrolyzing) [soil metagenome]